MSRELREKMEQIASAISSGRYRYTLHAAKQWLARGIKRVEIEQAIARGEIIEDYPQHHYHGLRT